MLFPSPILLQSFFGILAGTIRAKERDPAPPSATDGDMPGLADAPPPCGSKKKFSKNIDPAFLEFVSSLFEELAFTLQPR